MAIRVTTADAFPQGPQGARLPPNPAGDLLSISAGIGDDLMAMTQRAETADHERKKFEITNEANKAITETQAQLLEIQDPEEYRKTATEAYAKIADKANKSAVDDDMRMGVTQVVGTRLRNARVDAMGHAIRLSGEKALEAFKLSLTGGERFETKQLAGSYYSGLREQVKPLAEAMLIPEDQVTRLVNAAEGDNSTFRFQRDLTLYKEGNFRSWAKTVKSEKAFDAQYPNAPATLRLQGINQLKTYDSELFQRNTDAFRRALTFANMAKSLNPVGSVNIGPLQQAAASAAALASTPAQQETAKGLQLAIAQLEAHNAVRERFVTEGGSPPLNQELFEKTRDPGSLSEDELIKLSAQQEFLNDLAISNKQLGSKATAAQFVGGSGNGAPVESGNPMPAWDDPEIHAWIRNAKDITGQDVSFATPGETEIIRQTFKRGDPAMVADTVDAIREYDSGPRRAFTQEILDTPIKGVDDLVVQGLVRFPMSKDVVMQAAEGARSKTTPEVPLSTILTAIESRKEMFMAGSTVDVQAMESAGALVQALFKARGILASEISDKTINDTLNQVVGFDTKTGKGGLVEMGGRYTVAPPDADPIEFRAKFSGASLSTLASHANGTPFLPPELKEMKTGQDLLDAGMHLVPIGGGKARVYQGDRIMRTASGSQYWEIDVEAFERSTPLIRKKPAELSVRYR